MRRKQKMTATIVVSLILMQGFPAFAISTGGMQELQRTSEGVKEEQNSLDTKLEISRESENNSTEPVELSLEETWSIPATPPEFSAKIEFTFQGYVLRGTFTDFLPNISRVRPMYSLDGELYEPIGGASDPMDWDLSLMETEGLSEQSLLQNQICAYATDEPMESYLKQGLESFYIKLQITTEAGDTYDTQATVIERGAPQPSPENTTVSANFTGSMIAVGRDQEGLPYTYGKYQITARENATTEDVYALLPDTLPIEVRFLQPDNGQVITSGIVECEVSWKEPPHFKLTAGDTFTIPEAANGLVVPGGTEVSTPLGIYVLPEAVSIDDPYAHDEVRIVVNAVGAKEKPDISLSGSTNEDFVDGFVPLSLAFRFKPSGATSVKAYSYVAGDEDWTEGCELLSSRDVDANQSAELYGYVDVLQSDEEPYADYLKGETTGFLIGIIIVGGTFDGEQVILPWPGEYTPPTRIPELDGAGGNENNAGSGDGSGDSTEGGQRPDLPDQGTPPVTMPPPDIYNPPDSSGSGTTSSTSPDTQEHEGIVVSSNPPTTPDIMIPTEEPEKGTLPLANQSIIEQEPLAANLPLTDQSDTLVDPKKPSAKGHDRSNSTESEPPKAVGIPVAAAALLLGGGITVVAMVGAGSTAGGTGAMAKLLTVLRNFFKCP